MAQPLTDLASVREYMQKTTSDTAQDPDLETLIKQVSLEIPRFCERDFTPVEAELRSFELRPDGCQPVILNLAPFEARAIIKVTFDPDRGEGIEVKPDCYRLWPYPARDGTFFGLRLDVRGHPAAQSPFESRRVDIVGDWGIAEVPEEITRYANMTVESWIHLRRDGGVGTGEIDLDGEPPARADDLPPAVQRGLRKSWMRPVFLS